MGHHVAVEHLYVLWVGASFAGQPLQQEVALSDGHDVRKRDRHLRAAGALVFRHFCPRSLTWRLAPAVELPLCDIGLRQEMTLFAGGRQPTCQRRLLLQPG